MDNTDNSVIDEVTLKTEVNHVEEMCPAFVSGCPFKKPELKDLIEEAKKCPAFKDECMFKNAATIRDVYDKLSQMPDVTESSPHKKALTELLRVIHSVSSELSALYGDCPVFKSQKGCPFKTVCSDGKPLLARLDNFNWDSIIHNAAAKIYTEYKDEKQDQKAEADIKLATELKDGTKSLHGEASHNHFITQFMKGKVERKVLNQMTASLYFIYKALEEESEKHADHPIFGPIHFPKELSRLEALKSDLEYFYGDNWENEIEPTASCKTYVDRIHEISATSPSLLIAHHYARYLGDLSGGQIMKRLLKKHYVEAESDDGTQFYTFHNIADAKEFKNKYRSILDNISIGQESADSIVDEAKVAYLLNIEFLNELGAMCGFSKDAVRSTKDNPEPKQQPNNQSTQETESGDMASIVDSNSGVDLLKIIAAIMIVIAVLIGFTLNMQKN